MTNQSSTSPAPNSSSITANMSTSCVLSQTAANDIISRANYFYFVLALLGFAAAGFLLYSFIQTYRAQRHLAWLECLLWVFCGIQVLLLLLSLHIVPYRPSYLNSTALGCAALSFVINTTSLCGLLVLVLMAYILTFDPPSHTLLRKPGVCAALVILPSVLISVLLAGLRGTGNGLQENSKCLMDPDHAGVSYAATKLCLAFLTPYGLQVGLLIVGCIRQWKSKGRFLSGSEEGPMLLAVTVAMFCCMLFYNVASVRRAHLQTRSFLEDAFRCVSEFVLFSGSSVCLLLVLAMRRPCRDRIHKAFRQLRDCCRRPGHTQQNRNIIAPHIEIRDTLQDIES